MINGVLPAISGQDGPAINRSCLRLRLSLSAWPVGVLVLVACALAVPPVQGQFAIKPVEVTTADLQKAMRERPMIFGCGVFWNGRSLIYKLPEEFNALMAERVVAAGVTATRVGFDWAQIEEEPLEYTWEPLEQERGLERLLAMNIEVIGLISTVPAWASPDAKAGTYAPLEENEIPELFERFCEALAKRYRGKIRYWQFGHGQDIDFGWLPKADPVSYARWLRRAHGALKRGNPDCVVGTGGHMGRNAGFLDTLFREGLKDFCDAVTLCPGPAPADAAQGDVALDWKKIEDYRAVMVSHKAGDMPMWCVEYGWPFEEIGGDNQHAYMSRALDYLVHYEFITVGIHLTMADWHRGVVGLFGLCDKDLEPRPGYQVWVDTVKPLTEHRTGRQDRTMAPAVSGPSSRHE